MYVKITPTEAGLEITDPFDDTESAVYASVASLSGPRYAQMAVYGQLESWTEYASDKRQGLLEADLRRRMLKASVTEGLHMSPTRHLAQVKFDLQKLTEDLGEDPVERDVYGNAIAATVLLTMDGSVEIYQVEEKRL